MKHLHYYIRNSKRADAVWAALLFTTASLLLFSCGTGGAADPDKRAAASFLKPYQIRTEREEGTLYDLTPLIDTAVGSSSGSDPASHAVEDKGAVLACGLAGDNRLLLLRSAQAGTEARTDGDAASGTSGTAEARTDGGAFELLLLDLRDGSLSTCASFPVATPAEAPAPDANATPADAAATPADAAAAPAEPAAPDPDGAQGFEILSADPAIVFDRDRGIVYRPASDSAPLILPAWLRDCAAYCVGGQVYLSSERGILYTVKSDGELAPAWTLPCEYGAFTPVVGTHEGQLTFATWSRQAPSERILVDVDPVTGESRFYTSDLGSSRFSASGDGLLAGASFRGAPAVSVCDPVSRTKKELQLPEEILSLLSGEKGPLSFATVPLSLCGDWCAFMLTDGSGRPAKVFLWDTASCRASEWNGPTETAYDAPAPADYGALSRLAQELESIYGVKIVLGDNIPTEFTDYTAQSVTDPAVLEGSLSVLQNVLSLYPEGYFTNLKGKYYRDVVLYLTGPLTPLNADANISNASAFATESNGVMQVAFDLMSDLAPSTVIHELTHAADYRFLGEGLLNEEAWNALNPEGFTYYLSYIDDSGESYEFSGDASFTAAGGFPEKDIWFIDPYSKTFPMEDRARLMETLLSGSSRYSYCLGSPHVQEKLSWYFRFLRTSLGDDTWPARTSWEKALLSAAEADAPASP